MLSPATARVRVKICGITNASDAEWAIACGADALGFNLFFGSRRRVDLKNDGDWIRSLPPFVTRVAVLVNLPLEEALRVAEHPAIDMVQLHGDEDERYCEAFARSGRSFVKALRLSSPDDIRAAERWSTRHILLDAGADPAAPTIYGGSGRRTDTDLAARLIREQAGLRVTLAGGLTPNNVADALRATRPYAVDVASGVETTDPRRKDPGKVWAFIVAARDAV